MKEIPLTKGMIAIVDDDDFEWLNKWKWYYHNSGYAVRNNKDETGKRCTIKMHREILSATGTDKVDHINGCTLDNQRLNLRICDHSQNMKNLRSKTGKSKYKGVTLNKDKWQARIQVDGKMIHIGSSESEIACANAYNYYAQIYHGEFAHLNEVPYMAKDEWEKLVIKKYSRYK